MLARRFWRLFRWMALMGLVAGACSPNPAAPPAPPAEIPSFLVIPSEITIAASEITPDGPALKAQGVPASVRDQIENVVGIVEEQNVILDAALLAFKNRMIPVSTDVINFSLDIPSGGLAGTMKVDFGRFDFNDDGTLESCTGCTCPVGCAPDLSACPSEAPESDLRPICIRIWHNDRRFAAGVLDRVPTPENQESGRVIVTLVPPLDLEGSLFAFDYDRHDPQNKAVEVASFHRDVEASLNEFYARLRTIATEEGALNSAKKTFRLADAFFGFSPDSLFRGQAQYLVDQDPVLLETLGSGFFDSLEDITPPICASISSATPIAADLCGDLGLALTPGNFPPLPELDEVELPPFSEFPETPTF